MRTSAFVFSLILLCFCASLSMAGTVAVTSTASFTGGVTGTWSFTYAAGSGAPDLLLQAITIDLTATDLKFDTVTGGFGSLTSQDVTPISYSESSTPVVSASGSALDGMTLVTFSFLDFGPGDVFQFGLDVDHPDPTLLSLRTCIGGPIAVALCKLDNTGRTATNNARLLAAQLVGPNAMAGAVVTFTFGGTNYNTTPITAVFPQVTLLDIITGLARGEGVIAFNNDTGNSGDVSNPEPACLATFGAGLGLLIALARRRRA